MEQVTVLRGLRELVVNQSGLESLLRSDDKNSFGSSGANTAGKVVKSVSLSEDVLLNVGVGTKTDVVLGDREHEEGRVTLVEAKGTIGSKGILNDVDSAH